MTLPKEMTELIINNALSYAQSSENSLVARLAYTAGATEWAGKAQDLADALGKVKNIMSWMDGEDRYCQALRKIIEPALAKYKEATNE